MFTSRSGGTRSRVALPDGADRAVRMPVWVGKPVEGVDGEIWETEKMTERAMQDTVNDFLLGEE